MVDVLGMKFIGNVLEECDVVIWLLVCCTGCFGDLIFCMDLYYVWIEVFFLMVLV